MVHVNTLRAQIRAMEEAELCHSVRVEHLGGVKGAGVVAGKYGVEGGVRLVSEQPLVTVPSLAFRRTACTACLRSSPVPLRLCTPCAQAAFCDRSDTCASAHSLAECKALSKAPELSDDAFSALLLLCRCSALPEDQLSSLMRLCSCAHPADSFSDLLRSIWPFLNPQFHLSFSDCLSLLSKEAANSFGIGPTDSLHASPSDSNDSDELVGIALPGSDGATKFNHACLPNACWLQRRCESQHDLRIEVRTLRRIEPGEEVCISYFPINAPLSARQQKLSDEYGFQCNDECWRCEVERRAGWDEREGHAEEEEEEEGENERQLEMWLLARLCDNGACRGTMVPVEVGDSLERCECSRCGHERSYEELLRALSRAEQEG